MGTNFPLSKQYLWQLLSQDHTLFLSIFLVILFTFLLLIRNRRSQGAKLNLPPSPPRLPLIGNLHQLGQFPHRSFQALSDKYGPILLLHLGHSPTVLVSSPDLVKEIAKNHDIIFSSRPKSMATDALFYGGKDIAFSPHCEYWKQARKLCTVQLLNPTRVQSFHLVREEEVAILVDELRKASLSGLAINLSEILVSTTNNMVSRCILGQRYDTDEGGGTKLGELGKRFMVLAMAFCVGDFFPSLSWIDVVLGFTRSLKETSGALDAFYNQVIEAHKVKMINNSDIGGSDPKDFVDILLQLQNDPSFTDLELTNEHVKALLQDMLVGSIETTSTASEWLMAELLRNPRVMKKAQEEVRKVVGDKPHIDMSDINRMDYLKCVLNESLRLHIPGPLLLPRETSTSVEIGGYRIPANTKIIINGWAIHMHQGFWDRPEEFIPERFENSPIDFKSQEYFQLIPFGFGRRQCPGMNFGTVIIEYLIANLLYWFDWKLDTVDHEDLAMPEELDMSEVFGMTVQKKFPLHVVPIFYSP